MNRARVVLLVREGCHLCDEALVTVREVSAEAGASWEAVDVDSDPELRQAYTDHVPVTFVDGRHLANWFLDADRLRAALGVSAS